MEITQSWQVRYSITPTLSKSEVANGYSFDVVNGETFVTKTYDKNIQLPEERKKSKFVKKEIPDKEIKADQQAIREILLKKMIYTGSFSEIKVDPEVSLINENELKNDGFTLTTPVMNYTVSPWDILDVEDDYLSSVEKFWSNGFDRDFGSLEDEVLFISDWIEKSTVESKPIQSFMLLWIAFNCLYDVFLEQINFTSSNDTFKKITKTIKELITGNELSNILKNQKGAINSLASYALIVPQREGQTADNQISFGLQRMMEKEAPQFEILCQAMRCVYEIRNNLFHKGSISPEIEQQTMTAKNLLLPVTTKMLRNMIGL